MTDLQQTQDNKTLQFAWALYQHGYWCKQDLLEWIYQQLAEEPDNLLWVNLVFYDPGVYFSLYPEQFPPLLPLSFKQAFALRLAHVDITSTDSIDMFNQWLFNNFYQSDYDDVPDYPNTPECYYFYNLEDQLEYQSKAQTLPWVRQQLQVLIPQAQQQAQQLLSILSQS